MKILSGLFVLLTVCFSKESLLAQQMGNGVSDTLIVTGKSVVFFEPGADEMDSLATENKSILKDLADFRQYTEMIIPFLRKKTISFNKTELKVIKIVLGKGNAVCISRQGAGCLMGMILSDGNNEPLVLPDITADKDFFRIFKNYFDTGKK